MMHKTATLRIDRCLASFLIATSVTLVHAGNPLPAQPPEAKEFYQDFRNKPRLSDAFQFGGLDPDSEIKPENQGLRVTLPAERAQHFLSEVNASFPLTGDFDFTATYVILSAKPPLKGYGVGVNLTISTATQPKKFGKLCRVLRPKEGSIYLAESWPIYQNQAKKTDAMSGQLRLARIGTALYFLVSDGPGQEFQQIWDRKDYGLEEIDYAGFQVSDSGEPGNPVDARLIDLRIRLGNIQFDRITTSAPLAAPAPPVEADVSESRPWSLPRWLIAVAVAAVATLAVVAGVTAWLLFCRQSATKEPGTVETNRPEPIVIACSGCGKKLMARPGSINKNVKCPQCGKAISVPSATEGEVEQLPS